MENHVNESPAIPKWSPLLIEAVTTARPINTFPKWKDLGRFEKRGERALTLCMPITCKRREENANEEHPFPSFVYKARWFVLAQTDGQEVEPITIPQWDANSALASQSTIRTEMCRALPGSGDRN